MRNPHVCVPHAVGEIFSTDRERALANCKALLEGNTEMNKMLSAVGYDHEQEQVNKIILNTIEENNTKFDTNHLEREYERRYRCEKCDE